MAQHPKNFRTGDGKTGSGSRSGRDLEDVKNNGHATSSTRQMCSSWAPNDLDRESRKLMLFADVMQKMMMSAYVTQAIVGVANQSRASTFRLCRRHRHLVARHTTIHVLLAFAISLSSPSPVSTSPTSPYPALPSPTSLSPAWPFPASPSPSSVPSFPTSRPAPSFSSSLPAPTLSTSSSSRSASNPMMKKIRRGRQELEEKRKAEEEKKTKEEEERRKKLDFARKMEELWLRLRMDLNEEWRRREQEANAAVRDMRNTKNNESPAERGRKTRKAKRKGKRSKRGHNSEPSEESDSETGSGRDSTTSTSTSEEDGSRGRGRRKKEKGKKRSAKKRVGKQKNRKKDVSPVDLTPRFEHGECSKHGTAGAENAQGGRKLNEDDRDERDEEPKTPLTGGYKGISAGCSQKGLIGYCMSAHKIYSGKSAPDLRKLCDKKGIRFTKKPEVVELLTRQQVELAYKGFNEKDEEGSADKRGKGRAPTTPKTEVRKDRIVHEQTADIGKREIGRRRKARRGRRERKGRSAQTRVKDTVVGCSHGVSFTSIYSWLDNRTDGEDLHEVVIFSRGEVWIDGWKTIRRTFGETRLMIDDKRVLLKHMKERLQQGGTVTFRKIVKMKTTTEKNKLMLTTLLRRPRPVAKLANLTTNKLIRKYRAAGCFTEKKAKLALRWKIDSAIRRKLGTGVRRKVVVKLRFDSCIRKGGIRMMAEHVIDYKLRDRAVAGFMKTRIRVVWMKNKTVGQLLHNQKTFATEEQFQCTCDSFNLPKVEGHVATRFADLEDMPVFLRNSRNITRASTALKKDTLIQAVLDGTKHIRGSMPTLTVPEGTIDERRRVSLAWTDGEVKRWSKRLGGLGLMPIDRNHGDTAVFCPVLWVDADVRTCSSFRSLRLVCAECPEWMCSRLLHVFQGKAAHGGTHSAGGSAPHGEEPRRTTSTPVMATSRGGVGGVEQQGAQNLWCDYSKRVWYLDWACQDSSIPTTGRCGPVLFVACRGDTTRLVGSVVEYADEGDDILKFTLWKLYRSDGFVDKLAKGCMVAGRKFGGYSAGAMALPFFVPLSPGHDEVVHMKDFLEVCPASVDPGNGMDVDPGTSIRRPVGFARGDNFGGGVGGEGGLPGTPPDPAVGMSDDSEDECARASLKPGLQGSRRQGLLGESPIRASLGDGVGERLEQASGSTSPRSLVERIGEFVRGKKVAELSTAGRPGGSQVREVRGADETTLSVHPALERLQTEASPRREAGGNVAGDDELLGLGVTREISSKTTQSGGKRIMPVVEEREGATAQKRQRKEEGSARTPMTKERDSVEKRKRVGGGDDTPREPST
ncbi:hypothetical protein CBR_g46357 [Chara braunii]|uniref:Uncharacterized protein n=1 Tax=Chara braunii TaxID=69332 RepID=A0A388M0A8_CHABU|nr:hypothetical protein CBR_g46357 [Chara braunii]|eukprot:GBG87986.1 hypothetical protein CBR_g46357 [Chara braunii]